MVAQANAYQAQEPTQDALIDAGMSMLDVTGSNATLVFQVVGLEIENLNISEGSYDTAAEAIIELAREQKERNDNDGKDAAIAVMEDIQAAELERLSQPISVGGITMSAEDWDNLRKGFEDPAVQAQVTDRMLARGYSDAQIDTARHWATVLSGIAEWKQQKPGQPLPPEMQSQLDDYNRQPADVKTSVADLTRETLEVLAGTTAEMTVEQADDAVIAQLDDTAAWQAARQEQDFTVDETAELLERRSVGSTVFAFGDTREGPVISEGYNASAEGTMEVAKAPEIEMPAMRNAPTMDA